MGQDQAQISYFSGMLLFTVFYSKGKEINRMMCL